MPLEKPVETHLLAGFLIAIAALVPGVDRGAVGRGLILIGSVADEIVKAARGAERAERDFADGETHAIAPVVVLARDAGVG